MARYTMRQIAKLAGVSPATVSRVLNETVPVSPDLKERVMAAARESGYTVVKNPESKSHLIGLLLPRLSNPFYTEIIQGILDTASAAGFDVVIRPASVSGMNSFNKNPSLFHKDTKMAGLLTLSRLRSDGWLLRSLPEDLPIVQCCEYNEALSYPVVSIDHYSAAYKATRHLLSTGHSNLALFNSSCQTLYGKKREEGFLKALSDCRTPVRQDWILHLGDVDYHLALAAAKELFSKQDHPDAIFAVSDLYAAGIVKGLAELGLQVPGDVSVIGFDDTEISLVNTPTLTTIHQPRHKLGATACSILLQLIQSETTVSQYYWVESDLIIRGSTKSKLPLYKPGI